MRNVLLLSAFLVGLNTQGFSADIEFQSDTNAPIRFRNAQPIVIVHQKLTPFLVQRYTTAPIDALRTFQCRSVDICVITVSAIMQAPANCPTVSAYVDGVAMLPAGVATCDGQAVLQQSAIVRVGLHTIQSQVTTGPQATTVKKFEAQYTIYGRR